MVSQLSKVRGHYSEIRWAENPSLSGIDSIGRNMASPETWGNQGTEALHRKIGNCSKPFALANHNASFSCILIWLLLLFLANNNTLRTYNFSHNLHEIWGSQDNSYYINKDDNAQEIGSLSCGLILKDSLLISPQVHTLCLYRRCHRGLTTALYCECYWLSLHFIVEEVRGWRALRSCVGFFLTVPIPLFWSAWDKGTTSWIVEENLGGDFQDTQHVIPWAEIAILV